MGYGKGTSLGKKYFEEFSSKDLEGIQLDVGAAIEFLSSLPMVDSSRIGVVGAGLSSEYAVLEAAENSKIQALVLISGSLSKKAKEYLQLDHSVPVLGVVGKDDKKKFPGGGRSLRDIHKPFQRPVAGRRARGGHVLSHAGFGRESRPLDGAQSEDVRDGD